MFKNLLLVGLLAGVVSGSFLTLVQAFTVIPLIHQAEQYEGQLSESAFEKEVHGHGEEKEEWKPAEGWERLGFTWLANLSIASGFGLMMAAMMTFLRPKTWLQAGLFGAAGYYVFFLAPAFLLPPELPGSDSPHLQSRQAIWLLAVTASFTGMVLMGLTSKAWLRMLGILILATPYVFFNPEEVHYLAPIPLELVERFTWLTVMTNAILWVAMGLTTYWLSMRFNHSLTPSRYGFSR